MRRVFGSALKFSRFLFVAVNLIKFNLITELNFITRFYACESKVLRID